MTGVPPDSIKATKLSLQEAPPLRPLHRSPVQQDDARNSNAHSRSLSSRDVDMSSSSDKMSGSSGWRTLFRYCSMPVRCMCRNTADRRTGSPEMRMDRTTSRSDSRFSSTPRTVDAATPSLSTDASLNRRRNPVSVSSMRRDAAICFFRSGGDRMDGEWCRAGLVPAATRALPETQTAHTHTGAQKHSQYKDHDMYPSTTHNTTQNKCTSIRRNDARTHTALPHP